jgi:hypothetical protein
MQNKPDYSKIKLKRGKVFSAKEPIQLGNLIENIAHKLKFNDNYEDLLIMNYWSEFLNSVGSESLAKYTFAHRISKDRTLFIGVRSAVIANELQFIKKELEKNFLESSEKKFKKNISSLVFELRA